MYRIPSNALLPPLGHQPVSLLAGPFSLHQRTVGSQQVFLLRINQVGGGKIGDHNERLSLLMLLLFRHPLKLMELSTFGVWDIPQKPSH